MNRKQAALNTFSKGFNCCQAVLSVFSEELSLEKTIALKIAGGFGGGMRKGEVCGAVAGAVMVLGLKYGHCREGDVENKQKANAVTVDFMDKFTQRHQTVICKKLLGYDLSRKDEAEKAAAGGVFTTICPGMIEDAVEILETVL
jgi:C_GCAxxG_C_C family probable redox protein